MGTKCRRGRGAAEEKQLGRLGGGGCKPRGVKERSPWKYLNFGHLNPLEITFPSAKRKCLITTFGAEKIDKTVLLSRFYHNGLEIDKTVLLSRFYRNGLCMLKKSKKIFLRVNTTPSSHR